VCKIANLFREFGLLEHSLDVALHCLKYVQRGSIKQTFVKYFLGPLEECGDEFYLSAFFMGLLHDIGKIVSDFKVNSYYSNDAWNPFINCLTTWAIENNINYILISINQDREHKEHESYTDILMYKVLNDEAIEMILKNRVVSKQISKAFIASEISEELFSKALRSSERISVGSDITYITVDGILRKRSQKEMVKLALKRINVIDIVINLNNEIYICKDQILLRLKSCLKEMYQPLIPDQELLLLLKIIGFINNCSSAFKYYHIYMGVDTLSKAYYLYGNSSEKKPDLRLYRICQSFFKEEYQNLLIYPIKKGLLKVNKSGDFYLINENETLVKELITRESLFEYGKYAGLKCKDIEAEHNTKFEVSSNLVAAQSTLRTFILDNKKMLINAKVVSCEGDTFLLLNTPAFARFLWSDFSTKEKVILELGIRSSEDLILRLEEVNCI